jgi:RNA polymerase sigma-70 factor (ECF subfamily)
MTVTSASALSSVPECGPRFDEFGTLLDADVHAFQAVRQRLFGIAYRILGSAADADDVVQEAWIRWQETDRRAVRDVPAFLATATARLALNVIQSARVRHETHMCDAVLDQADAGADPAPDAERREALELGLLILIESLAPAERAAYLLREAFDYPHRQIGEVLGLTESNARQLAARARMHLSAGRGGPVSSVQHRRLVTTFATAVESGDLRALEQLLAADIRATSNSRAFDAEEGAQIAA